jgi:hypothetical protein
MLAYAAVSKYQLHLKLLCRSKYWMWDLFCIQLPPAEDRQSLFMDSFVGQVVMALSVIGFLYMGPVTKNSTF